LTKRKQKLQIDQDFKGALEELRFTVENPNKLPSLHIVGNVYKKRDIGKVQVLHYPPWEIGYQVTLALDDRTGVPIEGVYERNIFFKLPNGRLSDLKNKDIDWILIHTKALVDEGQAPMSIEEIAPDCMKISQIFMPMFLEEKTPKLVVPGGTGHA